MPRALEDSARPRPLSGVGARPSTSPLRALAVSAVRCLRLSLLRNAPVMSAFDLEGCMGRVCLQSLVPVILFATLTACETIALVPGADKVRITNNPSDVANCKAVGSLPPGGAVGDENAWALVRNRTIGLGGNTAFFAPAVGMAASGMAYACP